MESIEFKKLFSKELRSYVGGSEESTDPLLNRSAIPQDKLSEEQVHSVIAVRQAKDIKTIKNCLIFFVALTVIGFVVGIFLFLSIMSR